MADTPIPVGSGALAASGKTWSVMAQGVTFGVPSSVAVGGPKVPNVALVANSVSYAYAADSLGRFPTLAKNVKVGIGYVPAGVTVLGFSVVSDDLDSAGPNVVQSIFVGDSELVAGVVTAQAGTAGFFPCVPTRVESPTPLYLKTTTAPATAQAGTVRVNAFYQS